MDTTVWVTYFFPGFQEWQSSLQKYGGKAFNTLLSEGRCVESINTGTCSKIIARDILLQLLFFCYPLCRHVANFCESYLRSVASKTTTDFRQSAETQTNKFTQFEVDVHSQYEPIRTSIPFLKLLLLYK